VPKVRNSEHCSADDAREGEVLPYFMGNTNDGCSLRSNWIT